MTNDQNKERNMRIDDLPEPAFNRDPGITRGEFEDRALDATLQVFAASKHDGDAFLEQLNAKLAGAKTQVNSEEVSCEQTFFGLSPSLLANTKPLSHGDTVETKTNISRKYRIAIALVSGAAAMLVGFAGWQTFYSQPASHSVLLADADTNTKPNRIEEPAFIAGPTEIATAPTAPKPLVVAELPPEESVTKPVEPTKVAVSIAPAKVAAGAVANAVNAEPFWHFRLEFDKSNKGTAWIGNRKIQGNIPIRGSDAAFKGVCHEIAKHIHYYSPVLDVQWQGKLTISGTDFLLEEQFNGIDEMFDSGIRIRGMLREQISKLDSNKWLLSGMFAMANPNSVKLNLIHDRIIKKSLAVTDELVKDNLNLDNFRESKSVRYRNFSQLRQGDLILAEIDANKLTERQAKIPFATLDDFQNKSTPQLAAELAQTPQFDLFDDFAEFQIWRDRVVRSSDLGRLKAERNDFQAKLKSESLSRASKRRYGKKVELVQTKIAKLRQEFINELKMEIGQTYDPHVAPLVSLKPHKPALAGFELAMGDACHLCEDDAKTLDGISKGFGPVLARFDRFGSRNPERVNPARLESLSNMIQAISFHDDADQAMGTIDQMLQIENSEIRIELIKALGRLDSSVACRLLACYAKYDVEEEIRMAATDALRTYPPAMARPELIEGFSYPWPDAAKHAAQALVLLNDTEAVPKLVELLDKPDPRMPKKRDNGVFVHREMVSINHLRNCLLCHQDSQDASDKGRGVVPGWRTELPRAYYANSNPEFARVRADVTYLRQDFSLVRKVKKSGPWPKNQRFDYVARTRSLSTDDADRITKELMQQPNQYRASIDMALRKLTDKSPRGDSSKAWKAALRSPGS